MNGQLALVMNQGHTQCTGPSVHSVHSVHHSSRWRIVCAVQVHLKSSEKGAKLAIDGPMPYGRTLNRHK